MEKWNHSLYSAFRDASVIQCYFWFCNYFLNTKDWVRRFAWNRISFAPMYFNRWFPWGCIIIPYHIAYFHAELHCLSSTFHYKQYHSPVSVFRDLLLLYARCFGRKACHLNVRAPILRRIRIGFFFFCHSHDRFNYSLIAVAQTYIHPCIPTDKNRNLFNIKK